MKERTGFYIAKIEDENKATSQDDNRTSEKKKQFEKFASSYTGYNNEDKIVFPYVKEK